MWRKLRNSQSLIAVARCPAGSQRFSQLSQLAKHYWNLLRVFCVCSKKILKVILVDQFPNYSSDINHLSNPRCLTKIVAWLLFCIFDGMAVKTNNMICCFRNPVDLRYMYLKSIVLSLPDKHKSLTWSASSCIWCDVACHLPTSFPGPLVSASYMLASTQNTPKLS